MAYKRNEETSLLLQSDENEKFMSVSRFLLGKFSEYKNKRKLTEIKWLRNQNQYDGVYEQEVLKNIEPGNAAPYNKVSTVKADQFKARMTELTMPQGEKNYGLQVSNNPVLPSKVVNTIIENLNDLVQKGEIPEVNKEIISQYVKESAIKRAKKMEDVVFDQLKDTGYSEIISNSLFSAAIYGVGVVKGPYNIKEKSVVYDVNDYGTFIAKDKMIDKPTLEFCKVWDFFPDMDAKNPKTMDGAFFYHTMTKQDLLSLSKEPAFISDNIIDFLKLNPGGNFDPEWYETALISTGPEIVNTQNSKYRITEYWGAVPASKCVDIFDDLNEEDIDVGLVEVNIWMIDGLVIKCVKNPFDSKNRPFAIFNLKKTDAAILGYGLMDLIEELQRCINAVTRAIHDNMRWTAQPIIEVNRELIAVGEHFDRLFPGKLIWREGRLEEANVPVIRSSNITNHMAELQAYQERLRQQIDDISSLTAVMSGDLNNQATLGRTSSGIAQIMGAANITLREVAKQFDFFNKQIISLMVEWNMMLNDDEDIKGDYEIKPIVADYLIEKQLTANNLNQFINTILPEERIMIDFKKLLRERLSVNNLDPDMIMLSDQKIIAAQQAQQQQAESQQQQISASQQAQMQLEQQKLSIDNQKAQTKGILDIAKAQQLQQQIESQKNKDDLDTMNALSQIDISRQNVSIQQDKLRSDFLNNELNRNEQFQKDKIQNNQIDNGVTNGTE